MTWQNPPPIVTRFRTHLLACASFTGAGFNASGTHYPAFDIQTETLPACVLYLTPLRRTRFAEGVLPLVSGTLTAKFYFPSTSTVGTLETFAHNITTELGNQFYGLAWRDFETQLASDLNPGQRADGENNANSDHRVVSITAEFGLSAQ